MQVADFGLAAFLEEWEGGKPRSESKRRSWSSKKSRRKQPRACGTPAYAAPEVLGSSDDQRYVLSFRDVRTRNSNNFSFEKKTFSIMGAVWACGWGMG